MKPEKKIWTAEIEIYRLAMSNGPHGFTQIWKRSVCFCFLGLKCRRVIVDSVIFYVYVSREVPKARFRSFKIDLCSKFDQKWAFWHLWFFNLFFDFSFFPVSFFTFLTITQICPIWFQYRGQDYETQVAVSFSWPKYWNRWNFWFRVSHMIYGL